MEILNHSQIATTMTCMGHVMPATTRDAADRIDSLFSQASSYCCRFAVNALCGDG
jgi:hypothetical protein